MYQHSNPIAARRVTAAAAALVLALSGRAHGDFVLFGNQHLDVTTSHTSGTLWDWSSASVLESGSVGNLDACHFSTVHISGGRVSSTSTPTAPAPCTCPATGMCGS